MSDEKQATRLVSVNDRVVGRTVRVSPYEVVGVLEAPDKPWDLRVGVFRDRKKAAAAVAKRAKVTGHD